MNNATSYTPTNPTQDIGRELLTVQQAAELLQVSQSSIRSYIRTGHLKAFRVAGLRKVLISQDSLAALLVPA